MKVEQVNKNSALYQKLQEFVVKHRLVFNSAVWLKNYPEETIFQCVILNKNNDIIGCFIYYQFKKMNFKCIITPPFSPNVDLFFVNPSESIVGSNSFHKDLLNTVADYFDGLNVSYINLNLPDKIIDTQPFIWKHYLSRNRYSYLIDLSKTKDQLWDSLATEKRKSVNKALKDGLEIKEVVNPELVYSLVCKSLERNELTKNRNIIRNILFSFATPQNSMAFVAYHHGLPLGATFCVISANKAIYLFGGFDSENKHHGAGVSCMWHSIMKAKELGLEMFDFEGSMNPAIERYYREFGGNLTPYFNVQKVSFAMKILLALKQHNPI